MKKLLIAILALLSTVNAGNVNSTLSSRQKAALSFGVGAAAAVATVYYLSNSGDRPSEPAAPAPAVSEPAVSEPAAPAPAVSAPDVSEPDVPAPAVPGSFLVFHADPKCVRFEEDVFPMVRHRHPNVTEILVNLVKVAKNDEYEVVFHLANGETKRYITYQSGNPRNWFENLFMGEWIEGKLVGGYKEQFAFHYPPRDNCNGLTFIDANYIFWNLDTLNFVLGAYLKFNKVTQSDNLINIA